ncbi:hypothetical protein BH09PSE2_BH09PSE2_10870 [soil metagenome]
MRSVVHQIWPAARAGEEVTLFRSHRPDYADGGQLRDFVYVKDCAQAAAWLLEASTVAGVFNLGTGQARSFKDLASATFAAARQSPTIAYVDTPEAIRDRYQYFTQAQMSRLRSVGYEAPFMSLEAGVADYCATYLSQPDPYA